MATANLAKSAATSMSVPPAGSRTWSPTVAQERTVEYPRVLSEHDYLMSDYQHSLILAMVLCPLMSIKQFSLIIIIKA